MSSRREDKCGGLATMTTFLWIDTSKVKGRIIVLAIASTVLLMGCQGYAPGRQSYWDEKVREMCERDGGVQIFEKLRISHKDKELLAREDGKVSIPIKELAPPDAPVYAINEVTVIRKSNPIVERYEWSIVRRSDSAVVARSVIYSRSGGDLPRPMPDSRYNCPEPGKVISDLQELFIIGGSLD